MKKTVAIIGHGYVGKAVEGFFKDRYDIMIFDPAYVGSGSYGDIKKEINEKADLAVICAPTPSREDGSVDTSFVESNIEWLETPLILIKSTVPPGTTRALTKKYKKRIAFSPETAMGEGGYEIPFWKGYPHPTDMKKTHFTVIGSDDIKVSEEILEFIKPITGPFSEYHIVEPEEAEMSKYVMNSYLSTIVTYFNEIRDICAWHDISYDRVRELVLLDKRVSPTHSLVFEHKRGFGGKCLPKDTKGIVKFSQDLGYEPELLKSVLSTNDKFNERNDNSSNG